MWRNQNYYTSKDSMLDLEQLNAQSIYKKVQYRKPSYVGRCIGECEISNCEYQYPLTLVRPDYVKANRDTPKSILPSAPELPYSKHTPPHWMRLDNSEKYLKAGYRGNRFFTYRQFGHTSKVETQSALCDFTNGYQFTKSAEFSPLPFYHTSLHGERPGNEIYPRYSGIIPSYKGHVPGMQHSYGKTFGQESVNAKRYINDSCLCLH
ncbi:CLUMA_CG009117, isoform A [Clunio marinus]|uniref:CLUMA_CG009117, isoform A n=1 Tax=Clunio marinus TaxID=568069 RepID=A0A1J1I643_9DIPT|nr:CLUMA_CG009117, isoform A [Clunio marinus]